jgi:hypothetical protein
MTVTTKEEKINISFHQLTGFALWKIKRDQ